jgi:hypothetical protein
MAPSPQGKQSSQVSDHAQIFVSHSSHDFQAARTVADYLENRGVSCWLAHRAVEGGEAFPERIVEAIRGVRLVILLASPESNESLHVRKEIILAADEGKALLPVRLVEFQPWGHLRYFLADCQWVDVAGGQLSDRLELIADSATRLMNTSWVRKPDGTVEFRSHLPGTIRADGLGLEPLGAYLPLRNPRSMPCRVGDQPSLLLQAYREFIPLGHRQDEMQNLLDFAESTGFFRWRVLTGEGGVGKTRLARELVKKLGIGGWQAGMLDSGGLRSFLGAPGFSNWEPSVPTFIVIDYAASKCKDLKVLLAHFATVQERYLDGSPTGEPQLRLLLLERHGEKNSGWLKEAMSSGESIIRELVQVECFDGAMELPPLKGGGSSSDRQAAMINAARGIIESTIASWSSLHGVAGLTLPDFSDEEWGRIRCNTGNRPLYLQMAALHACNLGTAQELPCWGRGQLLTAAVEAELRYIDQACGDRSGLSFSVSHLAAVLCLTGIGLARSGRNWLEIVRREIHDLGLDVSPNMVEEHRKAIFHEPETVDGETETSLVQPDIIAEGFAATVILRGKETVGVLPHEILTRVVRWSGIQGWGNLLRLVQDLQGLDAFPGIEQWPFQVLDECDEKILGELVLRIPERTASLHELGLRANERLLSTIPPSADLDRAACLLRLGTHRQQGHAKDPVQIKRALEEFAIAAEILGKLWRSAPSLEVQLLLAKVHKEAGGSYGRGAHFVKGDAAWETRQTLLSALAAVGAYPAQPEGVPIDSASVRLLLDYPPPDNDELACSFTNALNNLTIDFSSDWNDPDTALALIQRAVEIGENLALRNWRSFAADLARYLNNLSIRMQRRGDIETALVHARRSLAIREELAQDNPDQYAAPCLFSLEQTINIYRSLENWLAEAEARERLVQIFKELVLRDPESYRRDLARQLPLLVEAWIRAGRGNHDVDQQVAKSVAIAESLTEDMLGRDFYEYALALMEVYLPAIRHLTDLGQQVLVDQYLVRLQELGAKAEERFSDNQLQLFLQKMTRDLAAAESQRDPNSLSPIMQVIIAVEDGLNSSASDFDRSLLQTLQAVGLQKKGLVAEAVGYFRKVMPGILQTYKGISTSKDEERFLNLACNISHCLVMCGVANRDVCELEEAVEFINTALQCAESGREDLTYWRGVLLHNQGEALFEWGMLVRSSSHLERGINCLEESLALNEKNPDRCHGEATRDLLNRLGESLLELSRGDCGHPPSSH